jgi:hypothetical protein
MVEQQPSKLNTRVRFPSPAPIFFAQYLGSNTVAQAFALSAYWCRVRRVSSQFGASARNSRSDRLSAGDAIFVKRSAISI